MIRSFPVVQLDAGPHTLERFREWASQFGIFRLGRSLGVSARAVQRYLAGDRRPHADMARMIVALSQVEPLDGLPLTFEDLYGPAVPVSVETRTVKKVQAWE